MADAITPPIFDQIVHLHQRSVPQGTPLHISSRCTIQKNHINPNKGSWSTRVPLQIEELPHVPGAEALFRQGVQYVILSTIVYLYGTIRQTYCTDRSLEKHFQSR
jgi:hypothetical protein